MIFDSAAPVDTDYEIKAGVV